MNMIQKAFRRLTGRSILILLMLTLTVGAVIENTTSVEAATIRITRRVTVTVTTRIKRKTPTPYLNYKKVTLYSGDRFTLNLKNASSGVSWYATNKCVRLKKKGTKVVVYHRKKGTCRVVARC